MAQGIESVICPQCGHQISTSSPFCPLCGLQLSSPDMVPPVRGTNACPRCGSATRQGSLFCTACGTRLPTTYIPPPSPRPPKKSPIALVAIIAVILAVLVILAGLTAVLNGSIQGGRSELSPIAPSVPSSSGLITRTFSWTYNYHHYSWNISIDYNEYLQYRDKAIQRYMTMSQTDLVKSFVTPADSNIVAISKALNDSANSYGLDQNEKVNYVLAFVQGIPYSSDINTTGLEDYFRFPVETLCDYTGDCEDKSFLFSSITEALGYSTAMVLYDDPTDNTGHMGVGVACSGVYGTYYDMGGTRYFYCETTDSGWKIGELPPNLDQAQVIPIS